MNGTVLLATGHYLRMGVVQMSLANLLIIVAMLVLFLLALLLPFPRDESRVVPDVRD